MKQLLTIFLSCIISSCFSAEVQVTSCSKVFAESFNDGMITEKVEVKLDVSPKSYFDGYLTARRAASTTVLDYFKITLFRNRIGSHYTSRILNKNILAKGQMEKGEFLETLAIDQKYNFILTDDKFIAVSTGQQSVQDFLSKHFFIANHKNNKGVLMAGEIWRSADGQIHLNNFSGTYQPLAERLQWTAKYFRESLGITNLDISGSHQPP